MFPQLLDFSADECRRSLRATELNAYASLVTAFRAQGRLCSTKHRLLHDVAHQLHIPDVRHRAEIRRAVNDEKLTTIANFVTGTVSNKEWLVEGRHAPNPAQTSESEISRKNSVVLRKSPVPQNMSRNRFPLITDLDTARFNRECSNQMKEVAAVQKKREEIVYKRTKPSAEASTSWKTEWFASTPPTLPEVVASSDNNNSSNAQDQLFSKIRPQAIEEYRKRIQKSLNMALSSSPKIGISTNNNNSSSSQVPGVSCIPDISKSATEYKLYPINRRVITNSNREPMPQTPLTVPNLQSTIIPNNFTSESTQSSSEKGLKVIKAHFIIPNNDGAATGTHVIIRNSNKINAKKEKYDIESRSTDYESDEYENYEYLDGNYNNNQDTDEQSMSTSSLLTSTSTQHPNHKFITTEVIKKNGTPNKQVSVPFSSAIQLENVQNASVKAVPLTTAQEVNTSRPKVIRINPRPVYKLKKKTTTVATPDVSRTSDIKIEDIKNLKNDHNIEGSTEVTPRANETLVQESNRNRHVEDSSENNVLINGILVPKEFAYLFQ